MIVGGGYTGTMAAARLAARGHSVALLEQHELGWGASSRNGGMVHPGYKMGAGTLLRRYGDRGRQLYQASLDAFALVGPVARGLVDDHTSWRRPIGLLAVSLEHEGEQVPR